MKRHRGQYKPDNPTAYELSRSRIENFIRCPACFYLQQAKGIKFPSIPGFNINEATDILLKRDFDQYRGGPQTHPFLDGMGMGHLVPFSHEDFELWTQSLHFGSEGRMHTVHEESNIKLGGGLDDIWLNTETNELHIVDYKSTSQKADGKQITLDDPWKLPTSAKWTCMSGSCAARVLRSAAQATSFTVMVTGLATTNSFGLMKL